MELGEAKSGEWMLQRIQEVDTELRIRLAKPWVGMTALTHNSDNLAQSSSSTHLWNMKSGSMNERSEYYFKEPVDAIVCCSCGEAFKNSPQLLHHLDHHHRPTVRFFCEGCPSLFKSMNKLQDHAGKVHGVHHELKPRSFFVTPDSQGQINTISKMRDKKRLLNECLLCQRVFPNLITLKIHCVQEHLDKIDFVGNSWFKCPLCTTRLFSVQRFLAHIRKDVDEHGGYPCQHCRRVFSSFSLVCDHQADCYSLWAKEIHS